jgi:general secretion pathway protein K
MIGPLLTLMGVKPVAKFQSESEFSKSISTESKVFSIYAIGVVKGYKHETRVRIHAVADFRSAPVVTPSAVSGAAASAAAAPAAGAASSSSQNGIMAALQPSVGGQMLYYTIE